MRRSALIAAFMKELRLLGRDVHGLALLFVVPLAFILVMSLALQDLFEARSGAGIKVLVVDRDGGERARALYGRLARNEAFAFARSPTVLDAPEIAARLRRGDFALSLEIAADYGARLGDPPARELKPLATVTPAADTSRQIEMLFVAALREAMQRERAELVLGRLGVAIPQGEDEAAARRIAVAYASPAAREGRAPSAVQQNVPAWLVFALFFVAAPFSNAFIRERHQGGLKRLRTTNMGVAAQFAGKLAPYFVVNQVQIAVMLAAGVFVVPLLGGEALSLASDPAALVLLSAALSIAALGLALLIAVTVRTSEQAMLLSGLLAIVMAAVGGVMVPKFVMPSVMQRIAEFSPMSWGVDGFLDLILRGGGIADIQAEVLKLAAFGATALILACALYKPQE
jgi:ABC-2 type transport system permease protein